MFRFSLAWAVVQAIIQALHSWGAIGHYLLVELISYTVLIAGIVWGGWRAYVGMERDGDFYGDFPHE